MDRAYVGLSALAMGSTPHARSTVHPGHLAFCSAAPHLDVVVGPMLMLIGTRGAIAAVDRRAPVGATSHRTT